MNDLTLLQAIILDRMKTFVKIHKKPVTCTDIVNQGEYTYPQVNGVIQLLKKYHMIRNAGHGGHKGYILLV